MSLDNFFRSSEVQPVLGCYLWPRVLLAEPDWEDAFSCTGIRWTIATPECRVLVTVNGGMFVEMPLSLRAGPTGPGMRELDAKATFERRTTDTLNLLVCELATHGIVSEPASPVFLNPARVVDGHALITQSGGGRELYFDRAMGWAQALLGREWYQTSIRVMPEVAVELPRSVRIRELSADAPTLVAGAYSGYSRGQLAETLLLSWIVIEQFIDALWRERLESIDSVVRRRALKDARTYSAAVRTEILQTDGTLTDDERAVIDRVRQHRNALAHRGQVGVDGARDAATALQLVLQRVCEDDIAPLVDNVSVGW